MVWEKWADSKNKKSGQQIPIEAPIFDELGRFYLNGECI